MKKLMGVYSKIGVSSHEDPHGKLPVVNSTGTRYHLLRVPGLENL